MGIIGGLGGTGGAASLFGGSIRLTGFGPGTGGVQLEAKFGSTGGGGGGYGGIGDMPRSSPRGAALVVWGEVDV